METMEEKQVSVPYPTEWQEVTLGSIAKISSGGTPSRDNATYWNGEIPWLTTSSINFNTITQAEEFITEAALKNSSAKIFPAGTLLMAMYGQGATRGRVARLAFPAATNQACAAITVTGADTEFVYYSLVMRYEEIRNIGQGGNQKNLNAGLIKTLKIGLPPVDEQHRIVGVLSSLSTTIDAIQDLLAAKRTYKSSLMQQLLTGQRRFPEFQGQPWREVKLGNILQEVSRDIVWDDEELYDLVSVRRRSGGLYFRESLHGHQILTKGLKDVHAGDFMISKMQVVHGASGLATEEFEGMKVSGSYISLVSKNEGELLIEFFNFLSQLPQLYNLALLASHGVHIEKMTFNLRDYFKHSVLIPPAVQEQRKIVQTIEALNQEIELLQAQLRQWQQQKKGLMQQLLTGQLRVPHA